MCEFCMRKNSKRNTYGKDYPIHPCGNGDLGVRAMYFDAGIILLKDYNTTSGYFDINYCPICGRRVNEIKEECNQTAQEVNLLTTVNTILFALICLCCIGFWFMEG